MAKVTVRDRSVTGLEIGSDWGNMWLAKFVIRLEITVTQRRTATQRRRDAKENCVAKEKGYFGSHVVNAAP